MGVLGFVTLLLAGELPQLANLPVERSKCDRAHPTTSDACYSADERTYLIVAQWVRDSTPATARFMASKEAAFYTHAGRQVVNQIRALREELEVAMALTGCARLADIGPDVLWRP